jgi:hypothetical protein
MLSPMARPDIAGAITRGKLEYVAMQRRIALLRGHFALETDRAVYLSLAVLERRRAEPAADTGSLGRYELRCFSQNGEDGVLAEILARIGSEHRFFVEFGIQDGRQGNCVLLADVEGWSGLFIEADPGDYGRLQAKYELTARVRTQNAFVSPENIESLFADAVVPADLDVLSIDIDGQDYWIWEAIESYRPRVVIVEYNSHLPASRKLVMPKGRSEPWDGSDYIGSSLAAFEDLGRRKGYVLVHTELTALNAFFVREDLAAGRFPAPDQVDRRVLPDYHLQGVRYLADPLRRSYVDLDHV